MLTEWFWLSRFSLYHKILSRQRILNYQITIFLSATKQCYFVNSCLDFLNFDWVCFSKILCLWMFHRRLCSIFLSKFRQPVPHPGFNWRRCHHENTATVTLYYFSNIPDTSPSCNFNKIKQEKKNMVYPKHRRMLQRQFLFHCKILKDKWCNVNIRIAFHVLHYISA